MRARDHIAGSRLLRSRVVGRLQPIRQRLSGNRHFGQDLERVKGEFGLSKHFPTNLVSPDDAPTVQRTIAAGVP
jgi:hypothetical protein